MADPHEALHETLADKYELEEVLGEGGMGTVYLARDRKHDRPVAIKTIHPDRTSEDVRTRFKREISITSHLQHPHILPLLDSGVAGETFYYVMPFVEGESLRQRLDHEGRLPLEEALRIARHVANGLGYAHGHGVVHRDIKPGNIMLSAGEAVVADFGIARAITEAAGEHLTQTGLTIGSPAYMSPEQVSGEGEVDGRSDIYSLGCVLYEMLAGEPPFAGGTPLETLARSLREQATPLRSKVEGVPPDVERAVHKALAKKPKDRYETAEAFAEALTGGREAAAARALTPARIGRRWLRIGAAVRSILPRVGVPERGLDQDAGAATDASSSRIAVFPFSVRGAAEIGYLGEGMVDLLSTKLDGAGELRSVDARALLAALEGAVPDIQRARQVARRYGAGLVVLGNIVEVGGRLQLSASVYRTRGGAPITSARAEGQTDRIFELVDDVAAQMLGDLRGGPGARVRQIAAVTTTSLPALKFYLAGEQAYRAGEFEPAVEAFQQAISKDSAFALAHYRLSLAAEWVGRSELSFDAATAADRHAARLSERERRLLEALLVWRRGEARRAEDLYRAHVGAYPDDLEGWFQLGEVLFHGNAPRGRSVMEARPAFEEVLTLEPNHTQAAVHMARMAAGERNLEELDSLVGVQVRMHPESDRALEMLALQAFSHRDKNQERRVIARLEHTNDVTLIISAWSVALFTDNLHGAERLARLLAAPSRPRELTALGHAWLAHLLLARGRWEAAREEFTAVEAADPVLALEYRAQLAAFDLVPGDREKLALRAALESMDAEAVPPSESANVFFNVHNDLHPALRVYLLGLLSVGLGDPAAARQLAAQLEIMSPPPSSEALTSDWARGIRALALRSEGRVSEALGTLEETRIEAWEPHSMASPFFSQAFQRFLRAELLREAGKPGEAIEWYRHLGHLVGTSPFELCLLPLALYGQAQAYETLGDLDRAAEHYAGFIELWAHADEEYQPRVQAAQQRLEEIVAERG